MLKLALRNTARQRARSATAMAAIIVGTASLVLSGGFVHDIILQLGEALIHSQSGHIQINRRGFFDGGTRSPEKFLIEEPELLRTEAAGMEEVDDVLSRISFSGLLSTGRSDLAVFGEGIEPSREARLGTYLKIKTGRQLSDQDQYGALIGSGVARSLKLGPGDHATLLISTAGGALNTLDVEVVGVFQTFSKDFDARAVRISLAAAQTLLDTGGVNTLVVSLKETRTTLATSERLTQSLDPEHFEVKTWYELSDFYEKTVALYDRQFGVLRLIILFLVLLSVANSVNMAIMERIGEFGTMMALGARRLGTFALVLVECTILGFSGSVIGVMLGGALAAVVSAVGIPMPPPPNSDLAYIARIQIVPLEILLSFAVGMIATLAAAILPAWHAARMPIVDALRQNM